MFTCIYIHNINTYSFDNDRDKFEGTAPTSLMAYREMTSNFKIPGAISSDDYLSRKISVASHTKRCSGDLNGLDTVLEGNDEDEDFMSSSNTNNNNNNNNNNIGKNGRMAGLAIAKHVSKREQVQQQTHEQRQRPHYFGSMLQRMFCLFWCLELCLELLVLYKCLFVCLFDIQKQKIEDFLKGGGKGTSAARRQEKAAASLPTDLVSFSHHKYTLYTQQAQKEEKNEQDIEIDEQLQEVQEQQLSQQQQSCMRSTQAADEFDEEEEEWNEKTKKEFESVFGNDFQRMGLSINCATGKYSLHNAKCDMACAACCICIYIVFFVL